MTAKEQTAYKESGVDWLGQIPTNWQVKPFWTLYRREKTTGHPDEELLSVYRDYGVIPKSSRDDNGNVESEDLNAYQLVEPNDLVMNKMKAWQGSIAVSDIRGIVSPAYFVFKPRHNAHGPYLHHLLRSKQYIGEYNRLSKGIRVGQWDLEPTAFRTTPVVLPPIVEQVAIAEFLDRETAQIDALIDKQFQLVELLTERRRVLVANAVTKGLSNNPHLLESGDEQIGLIPQGWSVNRVSRMFTARKGANAADLTAEYCATIPGPFPVYSGQTANNGVMASIDSYEFDAGSTGVIFTTTVGAKAMTTKLLNGKFSLSQNCMVIVPRINTSFNTAFAAWFFEFLLPLKKAEMSNHMQTSFRMSDLAEYKIVVPPSEVQDSIVDYLNFETAKIDTLISKAQTFVTFLEERRQALISAAVTGKIDVRGN